ncbi:phosphotransferase [Dactylosporangium fulvum]|uniref:Phosphotransferase n=1 Tax=Dactylosporangium fulvum TaxID=53359 RepID=A0ABY5VQ81_9ACTN|nr:phosphotransferase [Dactylosporangium fulvum]UWP79325.1 phosphotransferase [Dactylosporangium fulvum]
MTAAHADGRAGINAALVRRLIDAQFPQWSGLPVTPVEVDGWDNRTYRLGENMTVRLPTAAGYVPAVAKEHEWLPRLAPALPVAVPPILAMGAPGEGYPFPWSVRGWLRGETAGAASTISPGSRSRWPGSSAHSSAATPPAPRSPGSTASTGPPRRPSTTSRRAGASPRWTAASTGPAPPPSGRPPWPPSGAVRRRGSTATSRWETVFLSR